MLAESPTTPAVLADEIIWDQLEEAVTSLGNTAEGVAKTLRSRGFTGRRGISADCPIAHYLEACLGRVDPQVLHNRIDVAGANGHRLTMPPTPAVLEFVDAFDHGRYPELVRAAA
jgi:hypothetical protein